MTWLVERNRDPTPAGERLAALVARPGLLAVAGAHDPLAGLLARRAGFEALYLSGAALTATLGLPDLGLLALDELVFFTRALCRATGLPVLVDGDTGHGEALNVIRLVRELEEAGAAAVQIEDQVLPKKCGHLSDKRLVPPEEMARKVAAAVRAGRHLRVVARTDARETEGLDAVIARLRLYREAGAHVLFADALRSEDEIRRVAAAVPAPLLVNLTEFGHTPLVPAARLAALGARLAIWPVSALRVAGRAMEQFYADLRRDGTQAAWLDRMQTRRELYDLLAYRDHESLDDAIARSVLPGEAPAR